MMQPITMPALSDTMNNGRLSKWLKKPGDKVKSGEAVAEVETDKAIMEVEAFHDGYLAGPLADVDKEFPVGQTIGYIADDAAAPGATPKAPAASAAPQATDAVATKSAVARPAAVASAIVSPMPPPAVTTPVSKPSPVPGARQTSSILAAATAFRSDGHRSVPQGRRHVQHPPTAVASALQQGAPSVDTPTQIHAEAARPRPDVLPDLEAGPPYRVKRASSLREAVARNMIASMATPTFRVTAQLPLEALITFAKDKNISLILLLARACANTIKAYPLFNAAYTAQGLAQRDRIDIGIAVDSPDGLITPVLRDVSGRSLAALADDWRALRDKVKSRRLAPSDYRGATFYLSDLGVFPIVASFDSIVPTGASAILSVAAARGPGTSFTLSCDHRVIFGSDAARFLQTLSERLSEPSKLI